MSEVTATAQSGLVHEAVFYDSDAEFTSIVVPFLEGALEAGEPAVVAVGEANEAAIRSGLTDPSRVSFLPRDVTYQRPADTLAEKYEQVCGLVAGGVERVRMVGEVPHPGVGRAWPWWARYEAAFNQVFADLPLWGLCPYDTRITPAEVLVDVAGTHPFLATPEGHRLGNGRFQDPAAFLAQRPATRIDGLEARAPTVELIDPTPRAARLAARDTAGATNLLDAEIDDLVFAVNEAVTNGICHGRPPVRLRLWAGADRVVGVVSDTGRGPDNPFVGLLPPTTDTGPGSGGLGLWLTHRLCQHLTLGRTDDGFVVRLVVGNTDPTP